MKILWLRQSDVNCYYIVHSGHQFVRGQNAELLPTELQSVEFIKTNAKVIPFAKSLVTHAPVILKILMRH